MTKVEIVVPAVAVPKTGTYACACQKNGIKLDGKVAQIFWVANRNDPVQCGEVLCELEVQKTTMEIKSPCDGRLEEICIEDGGHCHVGSILGYIRPISIP